MRDLQQWREREDFLAGELDIARVVLAEGGADPADLDEHGLLLAHEERVVGFVRGVGLVEWAPTGPSFDPGAEPWGVGVGPITVPVGGRRPSFTPGEWEYQTFDEGDLLVSNLRLLFMGERMSREWLLPSVVGLGEPLPGVISISSSQVVGTSGINVGPPLAEALKSRIQIAVEHDRDRIHELIAAYDAALREHRRVKPTPPESSDS